MENLSCDVLAWGYKVSYKLIDDGEVGSHCCGRVYSRAGAAGTLMELLCGLRLTFLMCSLRMQHSGINKASSMRSHICNFWSHILSETLCKWRLLSFMNYVHALTEKCIYHKHCSRALGAFGMRRLKVMTLSMMHKDHRLVLSPCRSILHLE